jgi:UPF0042 nucleotide-binding protein
MRVVLITGISGSGKSIAIRVLEDDGFYCVDNLPAPFLPDVIESLRLAGHDRVSVSVDVRSGESVAELRTMLRALEDVGHDVKVVFLNAQTDTLVQRYSETRRRHPLTIGKGGDVHAKTLVEAIERERELMAVLESLGVALDTTDLHPNVLRQWVRDVVGAERAALTLLFQSFAYKRGVPLDTDLLFDARCLPNPYYTSELRPLTGLDTPVAEFLREIPSVQRFVDHIAAYLHAWLPFYIQENRSYLTVGIGCTGGQHRSVYVSEELARRFRRTEHVLVRHRGLSQLALAG